MVGEPPDDLMGLGLDVRAPAKSLSASAGRSAPRLASTPIVHGREGYRPGMTLAEVHAMTTRPPGGRTRQLRGRIQKNSRPSSAAPVATGPDSCALLTVVALMGAADRVERCRHGRTGALGMWPVGSRELCRPRTEAEGKLVTESDLSLRAPAQVAAVSQVLFGVSPM